ncbi:MAG: restriction endonuclease subunit S [Gemmiger sp.]|uniref:restriction endonuclease subunit S n=1 Tax=Gemmiger sp. TaxID=2049027 RepID=UPI00300F3E1A
MTPKIKRRIAQIRRGEIPEGYKKTKAGILPADWNVHILGDCLSRIEKPVEVKPNELYTQIGIRSHGKGLFYKEPVTGAALGNKSVYWIQPDCFIVNIVFAWEQAIGKTSQSEVGMIGSHRFPMYRPINDRVDIDYLISYLLTKRGTDILEHASPGGAGRNRTLGQEHFLKSKIVLPPIVEQQKIAAILTTQDKVIELKEKRLAEKQRQKKYLMQQLLTGKKRLPGFSGAGRDRLGKLFLERKKTNCESLEMLAITGTQGIIPRKELDLKDNSSEDKSKYLRVCVGDIGYNTMRMWQGVSAYSDYEGIVSPAYTILKPSSSINAKYFAYLFKTPEIIFLFYRFSQGLVDDTRNLKYENFKKIKVCYPPDVNSKPQSPRFFLLLTGKLACSGRTSNRKSKRKKLWCSFC